VSRGDEVFRRLPSAARSTAAKNGTVTPTQKYLIRHTLESFLDHLTRTAHAEDFVLKGGILLAAYGVRRPTKDADVNAVDPDVTATHLPGVVRDLAATVLFSVTPADSMREAAACEARAPQAPDASRIACT